MECSCTGKIKHLSASFESTCVLSQLHVSIDNNLQAIQTIREFIRSSTYFPIEALLYHWYVSEMPDVLGTCVSSCSSFQSYSWDGTSP